jgi:hypothetical protein
VYESCTNHRPQSREAQNFGLYQKIYPFFSPGISRAQTTPLSAAAPSLSRFLAHIPEPQIRVPNSAHLLLIAGISSFFLSSFPTPSPFFFYFYPSHQPLSSPRPASTGGSQLGSLSLFK